MNDILQHLFSLQDEPYRQFQCKLMPTVDPETVIGVRTPALRAYARKLAGTPEAEAFLNQLPHRYYEENNLHAFLLEQCRDYDGSIAQLERFLPYVDNWATCDSMCPKVLGKHPGRLLGQIKRWIKSDQTYTVRYGLGLLMRFYLDDSFQPEILELAAGVRSEEYYINMMVAWFFATALAKQYEAALVYLQDRRLAVWVHNKTIQKAVESYRITPEQKAFLRTLKVR